LTTPGDHRAFLQGFQNRRLACVDFFLDGQLARDDHVTAPAIQLQDAHRDILADERLGVGHRAHINLGGGHEGLDAHVHREAALGATQDQRGDQQALAVSLFQVFPRADADRLFVGQQDIAVHLDAAIHHHVHHVPGLHGNAAIGQDELLDRHEAFGFVAEVYDDFLVGDLQDAPFVDLALGRRGEMTVVLQQLFIVLLGARRSLRLGTYVILLAGHRHHSAGSLGLACLDWRCRASALLANSA
jgi:hypothetical protein